MRARAKNQDGYVMVTTIVILFIAILLGAAAMSAGVSAVSVSSRGRNDTQALEAAEAAANIGWNRINLVQIDALNLSLTTPCLSWDLAGDVNAVGSLVLGGSNWCPSTTVSVPGASSASYQYSQLTLGKRYVVGSATVGGVGGVGGVTRRVELTLNQSSTGSSPFGTFAVQSRSSLDFQNGSLVSGGGVRSDGWIKLEDTQVPCHIPNGPVQYGFGLSLSQGIIRTNNAGLCGVTPTMESSAISFPSVTVPTTNDDAFICVPASNCSGGPSWNLATESLTVQNSNDSVTLTGNTYVFCNLTLNGGTLNIKPANGKAVAIYFPPPGIGGCLLNTAGQQIFTWQNTNAWLRNQTGLGAQGLQIYMAGNNSAKLLNSSSTPLVGAIYAPLGSVAITNQVYITGAIAANSISLTAANADVTYDSSVQNIRMGGGSILYTEKQYTECTPSAGSGNAPDYGCN